MVRAPENEGWMRVGCILSNGKAMALKNHSSSKLNKSTQFFFQISYETKINSPKSPVTKPTAFIEFSRCLILIKMQFLILYLESTIFLKKCIIEVEIQSSKKYFKMKNWSMWLQKIQMRLSWKNFSKNLLFKMISLTKLFGFDQKKNPQIFGFFSLQLCNEQAHEQTMVQILGSLTWWELSLPMAQSETRWSLKSLSTQAVLWFTNQQWQRKVFGPKLETWPSPLTMKYLPLVCIS